VIQIARHNLAYQIQTAVDKAFSPGIDKHAAKHTGESINKVCSFNERKSLISVGYQFKNYMRNNFSEIKMVKDVSADHWQSFLNEKAKTCSSATLSNYVSRIGKIEVLCKNCFRIDTSWRKNIVVPTSEKTRNKEKLRVQQIDKKDLEKIIDFGREKCTSRGVQGIELAYRFGLRANEVANLKAGSVNIPEMKLQVIGKGGRKRQLPIQRDDVDFLKNLMRGKVLIPFIFNGKTQRKLSAH